MLILVTSLFEVYAIVRAECRLGLAFLSSCYGPSLNILELSYAFGICSSLLHCAVVKNDWFSDKGLISFGHICFWFQLFKFEKELKPDYKQSIHLGSDYFTFIPTCRETTKWSSPGALFMPALSCICHRTLALTICLTLTYPTAALQHERTLDNNLHVLQLADTYPLQGEVKIKCALASCYCHVRVDHLMMAQLEQTVCCVTRGPIKRLFSFSKPSRSLQVLSKRMPVLECSERLLLLRR